MEKLKDTKPTFIDLLSGCGGLSLGFEMAGFKSVLACDFWPPACLTFKNNFPDCPLFEGDVKYLSQEKLAEFIDNKNIDVVVKVGKSLALD